MDTYTTVLATCPFCHQAREYGSELVGRYTYCQNCKSRFYVEVPTLDSTRAKSVVTPPADPKPIATIDDILQDSQKGQRYIIDSIRTLGMGDRLNRGLAWASLFVGLVNLAALVYLLTRG